MNGASAVAVSGTTEYLRQPPRIEFCSEAFPTCNSVGSSTSNSQLVPNYTDPAGFIQKVGRFLI